MVDFTGTIEAGTHASKWSWAEFPRGLRAGAHTFRVVVHQPGFEPIEVSNVIVFE